MACLGIVIACFVLKRWPVIGGIALLAAVFAAISPRMKGPFGFTTPQGTLGGELESGSVDGEFDSPFDPTLPEAEEPLELGPGPSPDLPPSTESDEG